MSSEDKEIYGFIRRYLAIKFDIDLQELRYESALSNLTDDWYKGDIALELSWILNCTDDSETKISTCYSCDEVSMPLTLEKWLEGIKEWCDHSKGRVTETSWEILNRISNYKNTHKLLKEIVLGVFLIFFILIWLCLSV